ncbi:hypothetical protein [Novosphingobium panipatense]|uniref:Lipoprotein n=1 Tax=Novosphingobium panipatense TaxID=428991 RepID=A0ABY1Q5Z0_9SPHN|nr:hypothetical protein [Novosphingobium panipatense]SMP60582.1 hypothetical protein SAMN06296065_103113 [Novosphingobium panipatense]
MIASKPFIRRLILTLAPLGALAGCGTGPDASEPSGAAKEVSRPAAPELVAREADLRKREQAQLDWLKKTLDKPAHAAVYEAALQQARGRAGHCPDDRCHARALNRREARLDYADGKNSRMPNLPFGAGRFMREGYAGPVRLIPLIDGQAMLLVSLSAKGRPACALDGVIRRDDEKDSWTVTSLEEGEPMLVLKPAGKSAFDLSYTDPAQRRSTNPYCTGGASIEGRYTREG